MIAENDAQNGLRYHFYEKNKKNNNTHTQKKNKKKNGAKSENPYCVSLMDIESTIAMEKEGSPTVLRLLGSVVAHALSTAVKHSFR